MAGVTGLRVECTGAQAAPREKFVKTKLFGAAIAGVLLCVGIPRVFAQDYVPSVIEYDNSSSRSHYAYPAYATDPITVTGHITRVNQNGDRLIVRSDRNRRYLVDAYGADVVTHDAPAMDLQSGQRVRIVGRLLGVRFIEAGKVVILDSDEESEEAPVAMAPPIELAPPIETAPAPPIETAPAPVVLAPPVTERGPEITVEAIVKSIATEDDQLFIIDDNDKVYRVKADNADIIVPGVDRAGTLADIARGARIKVIGELSGNGSIILADRIRLTPVDAAPDVQPALPPAPKPIDLSVYTGIIIDVSGLEAIQRSPNPAIYDPDMNELYPDRLHVPTPDEVQDESTVRYYRTLDDARAGVGGANPLVLHGEIIVGPAQDGVMLSAEDTDLFKQLDKRLGFSQNWKVGFLVPSDR
jgi:hypothetical protein